MCKLVVVGVQPAHSGPLHLNLFIRFLIGYKYDGVKFERGNCGVSIMRSGEWSLSC